MDDYLKKENIIGLRPVNTQIYHECVGLSPDTPADVNDVTLAGLSQVSQDDSDEPEIEFFKQVPTKEMSNLQTRESQVTQEETQPSTSYRKPATLFSMHRLHETDALQKEPEMHPRRKSKTPKSRARRKKTDAVPEPRMNNPFKSRLLSMPSEAAPPVSPVAVVRPSRLERPSGSYTGRGGQNISVITQDITKMKADVIVNTTNSGISLGSGLASDISKAAGPGLTRECSRIKQQHGEIPSGSCLTTSGGDLQCKHVIHVNGPGWNNTDTERKTSTLKALFIKCLTEAQNKGCQSIAIPGICAGSLHFPV